MALEARAIVLSEPYRLAVRPLALDPPGPADIVVAVAHSGVSAGTERLLFEGRMPSFPGLGFPLVPGYETVGTVVAAGPESGRVSGDFVFVPGASCFGPVRGLFGGAAEQLVLPGRRAVPIAPELGAQGTLLALAATAHHALQIGGAPELIIGHGALGRLLARLTIATGHPPPLVWERAAARRISATGDAGDPPYTVVEEQADPHWAYQRITECSGAADRLDPAIARLAKHGTITLAGFYAERLGFAFAPGFRREATIRIAAEWTPADLDSVLALIRAGRLSLEGLLTHRASPAEAVDAYPIAFTDPHCLKLVIDWNRAA